MTTNNTDVNSGMLKDCFDQMIDRANKNEAERELKLRQNNIKYAKEYADFIMKIMNEVKFKGNNEELQEIYGNIGPYSTSKHRVENEMSYAVATDDYLKIRLVFDKNTDRISKRAGYNLFEINKILNEYGIRVDRDYSEKYETNIIYFMRSKELDNPKIR